MTSFHERKRLDMLQKSRRSTGNFGERQSSFTVSFGPQEMVNTYRMSEFRAKGLEFFFFFFSILFMPSLKPRKQTCPVASLSLSPFAFFCTKRQDEWPLSLMCGFMLVRAPLVKEYSHFTAFHTLGKKINASEVTGW